MIVPKAWGKTRVGCRSGYADVGASAKGAMGGSKEDAASGCGEVSEGESGAKFGEVAEGESSAECGEVAEGESGAESDAGPPSGDSAPPGEVAQDGPISFQRI